MDIAQLSSQIKKLRYLLIVFTLFHLIFIIVAIPIAVVWLFFTGFLYGLYILAIPHFVVQLIFCWFIWKKYPGTKASKRDEILMILFLGIIGMWLWLPSEKELYKKMKSL